MVFLMHFSSAVFRYTTFCIQFHRPYPLSLHCCWAAKLQWNSLKPSRQKVSIAVNAALSTHGEAAKCHWAVFSTAESQSDNHIAFCLGEIDWKSKVTACVHRSICMQRLVFNTAGRHRRSECPSCRLSSRSSIVSRGALLPSAPTECGDDD